MNQLARQGIYETVSSDFVLSGVKMRLGLKDSTTEDIYLLDIINRGIKRLRSLGTMIPAQADVPIENFKAVLPDGFIRFTKTFPIRLFNANQLATGNGLFVTQSSTEEVLPNNLNQSTSTLGVATQSVFNGMGIGTIPVFLNGAFYDGLGGLAIEGIDMASPAITVNIVNNIMYFSSNCDFAYAKISYLSGNIDEDGYLLIPAYAEEALTEFVLYTYKMDNADKYPAYVIQMHQDAWKRGKAHCKAIAAMPQSEDYQYINHRINSLI